MTSVLYIIFAYYAGIVSLLIIVLAIFFARLWWEGRKARRYRWKSVGDSRVRSECRDDFRYFNIWDEASIPQYIKDYAYKTPSSDSAGDKEV